MQDFHCLFNAKDSNTRFSLENRLVFDTADAALEETPAQGSEKLSETDRLAHLNSHLDDLDNLIKEGRLPESEDEMIKYHLARNIVRTDEDIDEFFRSSRQNLGFTIEDGRYNMNGVQAVEASDTGLYAFLEGNLKAHAKDSGMEDIGNEDVRPEDIAKDIIAEAKIAKGNYDFLSKNYSSFEEFKKDFEKVVTLREMAKVKRDYEGAREKTVTRTKIKESELAFETKVQIVKNKATTATQAALLWYAINFNPKMSYENLNLEDIFNPRDIEENGIAIVNGRLVVAYKPKDKPLTEGVQYEYATYGYNQYNIDPAIQLLRDQNNEYGGKKGAEIADLLESGVAIFEGLAIETEDIIKSYEENAVFQANYELLQRIMLVPEGMLNAEIGLQGDESLGLAPIENIPEFAKEGGHWYFGRVGGKFYARTIHFIDKGECYVFDMAKGWEKTERIPEMEFAMPELYTEKDGAWEINQKALEMARSLELNPDEVLVRTLNVLCKKTARNPLSRAKLLDAFAFNPIPGATIPFPKLDKVEILLDSENYADSLTNIQDILHTTYVQRFPGLDYNTAHWLAGDIGQRFIESLSLVDSRTGKPYVVDQNGNPIDSEHKYMLSSKKVADNFVDAFRPYVEFTAEKQFSEETQARIDQIHKYIEGMYAGFFGKINAVLGAKFGAVGEILGKLAEDYARQPLGDVWQLAEELSEEWENLESEQDKTLTFKEFMVIYGAQSIWKLKDPSQIEAGSFLDRLSKWFGQKSGQSQNPQAAPAEQQPERSPLNVTDPTQLEIFKDNLGNLKYSFGQNKGQNIFTDNEIAAMIVEVGNTKDTSFTNEEQRNYVLRKMKAKLDSLQGTAKAAMQTEYDYLKSGTVPPEYAGTVPATGAPATPDQSSPEIQAGEPGSSKENPKELSTIIEDINYFGWHKANSTIKITSGQFKVDALNFINKDAQGNVIFNDNAKIEIVYKDANIGSSIATSYDGKTDTYDRDTELVAKELFTRNSDSLPIGQKSKRITYANGGITTTQDTIEEIRIYTGVGLRNPHLDRLTP